MTELPETLSTEAHDRLIATARRYEKNGDAAYERASTAYKRADLAYQQADRAWARARKSLRASIAIMICATLALVSGAWMLWCSGISRAAVTLHTRRITVGDKHASLEIPDGQCASALGVTICVPPSSPRKVSP